MRYLELTFLFLFAFSLAYATDPILTWVNQTPANITTTNIVLNALNITYNITGLAVNNTTAVLCYKTNSTVSDITAFHNGTPDYGWECDKSGTLRDLELYSFVINDNEVYPHTENYEGSIIRATPHVPSTVLANANEWHLTRIFNINATTQYNFYEAMFNSTTATGVRVYTCNSSYSTGNPTVNANCAQIASVVANGAYTHCHPDITTGLNYSCHWIIPYAINTTTQTISGIKITSNMTFLIRGNTGAAVNLYGLALQVRPLSERFTANNGGTWISEVFTLDAHLHQFDVVNNETFRYYACVNATNGTTFCASGINNRTDLLEAGGLPPTPPVIYDPTNTTYFNGTMVLINYSAAVSPNGFPITQYNITLNYANGTYNTTIIGNNSPYLNFSWNTTGVAIGQWVIKVQACDNNSLCSDGTSRLFVIDTYPSINITVVYPINNTYFGANQCNFLSTSNLSFTNNTTTRTLVCSLYLNGMFWSNKSANATASGLYNITFSNLILAGTYNVSCYAYDNSATSAQSSAYAYLWGMNGCLTQQSTTLTNTTTNTTYVYTPIVSPYVDVKTTLGLLFAGIAIFGLYHYINAMWNIRRGA